MPTPEKNGKKFTMLLPKPRRREERGRSRVLSAFSSGGGARNRAKGQPRGPIETPQGVKHGRPVPDTSGPTRAPSPSPPSRTTRSESRGTTGDDARGAVSPYQESLRYGSTSPRRSDREPIHRYNNRRSRSGSPVYSGQSGQVEHEYYRYGASHRNRYRSRSPGDRRCRSRSCYSPHSRAPYRRRSPSHYRSPRRDKYDRPKYADSSSTNQAPSGYHGRRSNHGPHYGTSAHPRNHLTGGDDKAQTIPRRRFRSRSPPPAYRSRHPANLDRPLPHRARSREPHSDRPRSQRKPRKYYPRHSRSPMDSRESYSHRYRSPESSRDPQRLTPYEPDPGPQDPSYGDPHAGTPSQNSDRGGSEGGRVTHPAYDMPTDNQSISRTAQRSCQDRGRASRRARQSWAAKRPPQ